MSLNTRYPSFDQAGPSVKVRPLTSVSNLMSEKSCAQCERGKYGEQKRAGHFPAFFSFKPMLLMTCLTPFTFFASLAAFDF